jgi:hypothetical protein
MSFLRSTAAALCLGALAACPSDPEPDPDDGGTRWRLALEGLDGALLSVWGTAADDVWMVGSDPGDGPYVLHHDGEAIERFATDARGDLWWVTTDGASVWTCGEGGLVLRHAVGSDAFEIVETGTDLTLFGIFSFGAGDTWAVGGDPAAESGVILRHDGSAFVEVEAPADALGATWFKVWGAAPDDVWIVGLGGTALHWDGTAFTAIATPANRPLLTVHGAGDDVVAVGGFGTGLIVHPDAGMLVDDTPTGVPQLNGVYVPASGDAVTVGTLGSVWHRSGATWMPDPDTPPIPQDYHAVYVDPEGGIWAVGGDIIAPPFRSGVLAHYGESLKLELDE